MLSKIITKEILLNYAHLLKAKGVKPGIDHMTVDTAILWLEINGDSLCRQINSGSYEPMPLSGFTVAKSNGKPRTLGKLTVIDSVIQKCLLEYMNECLVNKLSKHSFAYQKDTGVGDALSLYCKYGASHSFVCKTDISDCFESMEHGILNSLLTSFFADEKLCQTIMKTVKAPTMIDNELIKREKGIPQGAILSGILCNIYLTPIDRLLEQQGVDFIRYADDIVFFADTLEQAEHTAEQLKRTLESELQFKINSHKYKITSPCEIAFLGHTFEKKHSSLIATPKEQQGKSYHSWKETQPVDAQRTVHLVSDGILRQKDFSLLFETDETETDLPIKETNNINVYGNVIFDTGSVKTALKNGTVINLFSEENRLIGRFVPNTGLKSPSVIFEQLQSYYDNEKRLALVRNFLLASFHNTRLVIRYYNKQHGSTVYANALYSINNICTLIKDCTCYEELLLHEAKGREAYYACFDCFLRETEFRFEKRSRKPPLNEVNAMISFGNTLLYNYIATVIYQSSLDIRVGFLHATNKRTESLNLDIAEIFKPLIVDRTVFTLINRKAITLQDFETRNGGVYLNANGKKILIAALYEKLNTTLQIKDESMSYRRIIREEVGKLVRLFRDTEKYTPYKQVR